MTSYRGQSCCLLLRSLGDCLSSDSPGLAREGSSAVQERDDHADGLVEAGQECGKASMRRLLRGSSVLSVF